MITRDTMNTAVLIRVGTRARAVVVRQPGTLEQRIEADHFWRKFGKPAPVADLMVRPRNLVTLADYRAARRG